MVFVQVQELNPESSGKNSKEARSPDCGPPFVGARARQIPSMFGFFIKKQH